MLEFQSDMIGSIRGFMINLHSVLLKTWQKPPYHKHRVINTEGISYEENWEMVRRLPHWLQISFALSSAETGPSSLFQ